jgi:hypothetical protein
MSLVTANMIRNAPIILIVQVVQMFRNSSGVLSH